MTCAAPSFCYDKLVTYSQKYTIVAFFQPLGVGAEFNMADWPLHITVADVFAIDRTGTDIDTKLAAELQDVPACIATASNETSLGTARVVLIERTVEIAALHARIIDVLASNGAVFNTPEFTREGFIPHCTVQQSGRLHAGDRVPIDSLYLVDMFPNGDWRQRKVLSVFELQKTS